MSGFDQDNVTQETARVVVGAVAKVVGPSPVVLHEPHFCGNEWQYVKECLDSTFVSSVGKFVDRFEAELAAYTGARYAVAVVNGTAALHIALKLANVQSGDEVIVPALTFIATANAVSYCGAVPHFADCEESTLGMSAAALREHLRSTAELRDGVCFNRRTDRPIRAFVPMHTFGHPADIDGLMAIARDYRLTMVEDAAESLGSLYYGRHTGTFGAMGTLSFNGNKIITTGGGGAILSDDESVARLAKHITTTAKLPHRWSYEHDEIGYNYRMPNLNAALGCAQLEQMPAFLASKRGLFSAYRDAFSGIAGMHIVDQPASCESNFWLQTLQLDSENLPLRDAILEGTAEAGYMTRPIWSPIHGLRPYAHCPRAPLPVTESLVSRLINLPSSAGILAGATEAESAR